MIIQRISPRTKQRNTMDLPVTLNDISQWQAGRPGRPAQLVWPHLTNSQREFFMTGLTQEDWDWMFPPESSDTDDEDMGKEEP